MPSQGEKWEPDGGYIPRIMFYDAKEKALAEDIVCQGCNPKYKYYYADPVRLLPPVHAIAVKGPASA